MELNDKHIRKSLYTNDCIQWFFKYVYQNAQNVHYNNKIVEKFKNWYRYKNMYLCLIKIPHLYRLKILCTCVLMSKLNWFTLKYYNNMDKYLNDHSEVVPFDKEMERISPFELKDRLIALADESIRKMMHTMLKLKRLKTLLIVV